MISTFRRVGWYQCSYKRVLRRTPHQKFRGGGVGISVLLFNLVCTINSELKVNLDSYQNAISNTGFMGSFPGKVRCSTMHPSGYQQGFRAVWLVKA